jgi:hypothetical protein
MFLVALFIQNIFRMQAARVRTFLTLLQSIFLFVFGYVSNSGLDMFCHGDRPIFTAAQFFHVFTS